MSGRGFYLGNRVLKSLQTLESPSFKLMLNGVNMEHSSSTERRTGISLSL